MTNLLAITNLAPPLFSNNLTCILTELGSQIMPTASQMDSLVIVTSTDMLPATHTHFIPGVILQ